MTDTIPYPCHLSTTGTDKTVNHRPIRQSTANPYPIPIPANASVKCKNTLNTLATCIGRYWGRIGCGLSDKQSANSFNTNLNLFRNAMNSINLCQWLCCFRDVCHKKTEKCGNFEEKKRGGSTKIPLTFLASQDALEVMFSLTA